MNLRIKGARENNLKNLDVVFSDGLTVVTGVSGSGKSSLVFDTLNQEAQRRFQEIFTLGASRERLSPADVDDISGLLPTVSVGQNLLNRNPNSTIATASGLHPLLRLLFARFGTQHCPQCGAAVRIFDDDSLIELMKRRKGPLQVRVPLLREVLGSHKTLLWLLSSTFSNQQIQVDGSNCDRTPLNPDQPHTIEVVLSDTPNVPDVSDLRKILEKAKALGSHILQITSEQESTNYSTAPVCARCGFWLPNLEPQHFNRHCPDCEGQGCAHCHGTGMMPGAAATTFCGLRFDQLIAKPVFQVQSDFNPSQLPLGADRLTSEITTRLQALVRVGLGYVTLERPAPTLSRGEAQRLRLAVLLTSRLSDLLHLLDEPTVGQHPQDIEHLMQALAALTGLVIYIEHDRIAAARANAVLDLGPGAGQLGGHVVFNGRPKHLWQSDTTSGKFFSGRESCVLPKGRPAPDQFFTIFGANLHNLKNLDIPLALGRLNVVCGVSGSGKSTLVEDILFQTLNSGEPVGCSGIDTTEIKAEMVDQSPIGRNPRSNPATYTQLMDLIRECFAVNSGLNATNFSFNTREGACPHCKGMGAVEVKMRYLPSTWITCSECEGKRFSEEILAVKVTFMDGINRSIADVLNLSVAEAMSLLGQAPGLSDQKREDAKRLLAALHDIGLDYLTLGQPSPTLSGGEAQRVKLAKYLGRRGLKKKILILDEPSTGLHPADIHGLLVVLDRLVRAGGTIIVVEHHLDIIRAGDWVIELGPGSGPNGGELLFVGSPEQIIKVETPTSRAILEEMSLGPEPIRAESDRVSNNRIQVRGARANNLRDIDVDVPKNALTVVTGISGSGKSSLVGDVIEQEAKRRYLESLAMYERQSHHEGPQADVESIMGLGVTQSVGTQRGRYDPRSQLGEDTEITGALAVLFAGLGVLACPKCKTQMLRRADHFHCPKCAHSLTLPKPRHFSPKTYAAACQKCHGVGTLQEPRPEKLIQNPGKPLCNGAMYSPGFFPNGFLCKPFNSGYDLVQAFAAKYDFDPEKTPWNKMSPQAQTGFLFGDPEPMTVTFTSRSGNVTTRKTTFPGFYGWIRDWDLGGTYTETVPCPECGGAGLREPYLDIKLAGWTMFELREMPLGRLQGIINQLSKGVQSTPILSPVFEKILGCLSALCDLGLGYLHLDRYSATLSAGEAQRVKLAGLLGGGISGLTLLLDEPSRGMHPVEFDSMIGSMKNLRDGGNTVVVVEHDLQIINQADNIIDMGPGAGRFGGRVVAQGSPVWIRESNTHTGRWMRGEAQFRLRDEPRKPKVWLKLFHPSGHNLQMDCVEIPLGLLVGICGVSGSGKSTLIHDTLGRILAPAKQTTSVAYEPIEPEPYQRLEGAPPKTIIIDQRRAGLHNPASFLGVEKAFRRLFAESDMAIASGFGGEAFKKNCTACSGMGYQRMDMGFLPDIFETCEVCGGSGYPPETGEVKLNGYSLPEVMSMSIDEVYEIYKSEDSVTKPLAAARQVGLGYLIMDQPGRTLSGGEAQRLKIAVALQKGSNDQVLYILDEPTVGQHLEDIQRLVGVLQRLVSEGGSVLVVEHHPHVLAACDWLIELGPGGGPEGGRIIAAGNPGTVADQSTPTAPYLREILKELT